MQDWPEPLNEEQYRLFRRSIPKGTHCTIACQCGVRLASCRCRTPGKPTFTYEGGCTRCATAPTT